MSLTKSDIRYKNLYEALTAHEAYCEYMFSYGSKKETLKILTLTYCRQYIADFLLLS